MIQIKIRVIFIHQKNNWYLLCIYNFVVFKHLENKFIFLNFDSVITVFDILFKSQCHKI